MAAAQIFEDQFLVSQKDKDGKKFDRVSRLIGRSENCAMDLILDVNSELYPVGVNDKIRLVLARSLSLTGSTGEADGYYDASRHGPNAPRSLADDYEYVMFGKCYKFDSATGGSASSDVNNSSNRV